MGICGSTNVVETGLSRQIDEMMEKDHDKEKAKVKLLLLGAGESGKSTIFKQMRILYGKGFTEEDRRNFKPVIFSNVLLSMKTLLEQADEMGFPVAAASEKDVIAATPDTALVDERLAAAVDKLWKDEGVKRAFDNRSRFQLNDSADYYFDRITTIAPASYLPTVEDLLRSRVRTSGIIEETYDIGGVDFVIYDVGGQRNERKKWINCFDAVTAVIFVASLSEYDQVLYEDASVNRMSEAVTLFAEICNSKWFVHSSMILFLNKRDLFEKKIRTIDLRHEGGDGMPPRFLDYTGGCNYDAAKKYISARFEEQNRRTDGKKLTVHVTCATDSNNVRVVFDTCKEAILQENVRGSGFMES